jgi:transposase
MGKHIQVNLDTDERAELRQLIHAGNAPARKQTRARILLLGDRSQGQKRTDREVAEAVLCSASTVARTRRRYVEGGLPRALNDKGWPGAKPKLTGEVEAKLSMLACSQPPEGHARWTLRLLANQMVELGYVDSVSHVTIGKWLKRTSSSLGG